MFEEIHRVVSRLIGNNDRRKHDYGSLDEIKRRSRKGRLIDRNSINKSGDSSRLTRAKRRRLMVGETNRHEGKVNKPSLNKKYYNPEYQQKERQRSRSSNIFKAIKSVFSNEDQTLMSMASVDLNNIANIHHAGINDNEYIKKRILKSEAFKKKVTELDYNKKLIGELRKSRQPKRNNEIFEEDINEDRYKLLYRKYQYVRDKLTNTEDELKSVKETLRYSQEMNVLLQEALDKANIDDAYLKSRRDIKNLQKENVLPERELSPSPRRTVNPLFTSSPVRRPIAAHKGDTDDVVDSPTKDISNFYNKYPKLPETELLAQDKVDPSLSPVRIDYSRYSS
ncbi:NAP1-binding protein [Nakaseomyces bracarensis]|uniref:NAP1-binding protein n=1 Tax=Nakaseomyces bracarensis TaxID=273131 RepID=A0ABR4NRG1_9SACH